MRRHVRADPAGEPLSSRAVSAVNRVPIEAVEAAPCCRPGANTRVRPYLQRGSAISSAREGNDNRSPLSGASALRRNPVRVGHDTDRNRTGRDAGNTVASTTWTRSNPCGLPQRSLSNRDGWRAHGETATAVVAATGRSPLEQRRQRHGAQVTPMTPQRADDLVDGGRGALVPFRLQDERVAGARTPKRRLDVWRSSDGR